MKTRILFLLGSLLIIGNSHAQSPSEPLMVGVTTPLTLKIETDKNVTKCNVEISIPGVGNIEKEITSPNYEAVIEITPQQEGQLNIQWKGKTKFRGFNTTPACTGTGSIVVTATASNAQIKTNVIKEVQVTAAEKVPEFKVIAEFAEFDNQKALQTQLRAILGAHAQDPGIYAFYDSMGNLLYLDKATRLLGEISSAINRTVHIAFPKGVKSAPKTRMEIVKYISAYDVGAVKWNDFPKHVESLILRISKPLLNKNIGGLQKAHKQPKET